MNNLPEWNELTGLQRQSTRALWGILCDAINGVEDISVSSTYNLKCSITDEEDKPIKDAQILLHGVGSYSAVTGSAGGCTIKAVQSGKYSISIEAEDYKTLEDTVEIKGNSSLNFKLQKK